MLWFEFPCVYCIWVKKETRNLEFLGKEIQFQTPVSSELNFCSSIFSWSFKRSTFLDSCRKVNQVDFSVLNTLTQKVLVLANISPDKSKVPTKFHAIDGLIWSICGAVSAVYVQVCLFLLALVFVALFACNVLVRGWKDESFSNE